MLHNGSALAFQANGASSILVIRSMSPSSSGLGLHPFTVATRVQTPLEIPGPYSPAVEAIDLKSIKRWFKSNYGYASLAQW
jgi:hypothetical protein